MDSLELLRNHINTFKLFGLWPYFQLKPSLWYRLWSFITFITIGILFTLSLILSVFYSSSVDKIVDNLIITSSVVVVILKGINLFVNKSKLLELFQLLHRIDSQIHEEKHLSKFSIIFRDCRYLYTAYLYTFMPTVIMLIFQVIFSRPERRMWNSTYLYPYDWAKDPYAYYGGIVFQGISNCCVCYFAISVDTYGIILIKILEGYVEILCDRVQKLGKKDVLAMVPTHLLYSDLINCCKSYENLLRYVI